MFPRFYSKKGANSSCFFLYLFKMKNFSFLHISFFIGVLIALPTYSNAQASFSLEEVMSSSFPSHLVADTHNQRVAWVFNEKGVRNIWIAEGPGYEGRALTNFSKDDGQEISNLQFTADGSRILYIHGGAPNRAGEIPNPSMGIKAAERSIWQVFLESGELEKLQEAGNFRLHPTQNLIAYTKGNSVFSFDIDTKGEPEQLFTIRGTPGNLSWSPNSSTQDLAFVSSRRDHSFVGIYRRDSDQIMYLNPSVDRDNWPVWSPDGKQIAFIRIPHEEPQIFVPRREALPWSICVAKVPSGEVKELWKADPGMGSAFRSVSARNQLFWGANDRLIFPYEKTGWTQLYSLSVQDGSLTALTPGEFEVQYVSLAPSGESVLYSSNQGDIDRQHIWEVSVEGGRAVQLSQGEGIEWSPVRMGAKGPVFCLASGPKTPAHPIKLESPTDRQMLAPNALPESFPIQELVKPQKVVFTATDGMQIHGQLFLPNTQTGSKHPAVLFFHGGSRRQMLLGFHHRGYYHNAYALNQYLASKGYVVLSVNYRSGIGYGMHFREALNYGAGGASEFQDVVGAALYLQNRSEVDPGRIGLWGGSYGGYLTALGLARASNLFKAGVDIHGVHDWNPVIQNFIPSYNPLANPDFARKAFESSPMAFLEGWQSPVLLIHGDDDRNVPFSESVDLANALRKQGVYFEQLVFPDEVHGFLLHSNWLKAYEATADFFDRMLKEE